MPPSRLPFSQRQGFIGQEITIREGAPEELRCWLSQCALDLGWSAGYLRPIMMRVLVKLPDQHASDEAGILAGLRTQVGSCEWFKVYDLIEAFEDFFLEQDSHHSGRHCARDFAEGMLVALFGKRCARHLVLNSFPSAQAAVADGLLNRSGARNVSDLQGPRQCSDRTNSRIVLSRLILSASTGSRWRELTRAYSVF